jgi:anthranilate synthase/aminodeoxychorismate synthase-like glutamine amidotransferase
VTSATQRPTSHPAPPAARPLWVVDNYDSFVHNLARYLRCLGQTTHVVRNDDFTIDTLRAARPAAIVISPGPGTPQQAGRCLELVREMSGEVPMLGVCLGHQAIAQAWGARIVRAAEPMHGRSSWVAHASSGLFTGLPNPLRVGRYHSLVVEPESLPSCLRATAFTHDGTLMAFEHERWPIFGVQFHPESVLTEYGEPLLAEFLRRADLLPRPIRTNDSPNYGNALTERWPAYPFRFEKSS